MHVVICVDGLDPAYLAALPLPHLARVISGRPARLANSALPSVTNVNNLSLVTGRPPAEHGIIGNYWLNAEGREGYLEEPSALLAPTVFERFPEVRSLVLVAKAKLLRMVGKGASQVLTAEDPPEYLTRDIGRAPPVYSAEVSVWLLDALLWLLERERFDLAYVSTTDYVMHKHAPGTPSANAYLMALDERVGRLLDMVPDARLVITADHGMNDKRTGLDLERVLRRHGIASRFIPAIKDRYVVHHDNLGGFGYLHLDPSDIGSASAVLKDVSGVERVLARSEAARELRLHPGRIGDLTVLGGPEIVFGPFPEERHAVSVRSHGSLHERSVPFLTNFAVPHEENDATYDLLHQVYASFAPAFSCGSSPEVP